MVPGTHDYFSKIHAECINDGYLSGDFMRLAVGVNASNVPQCMCAAHQHLNNSLPEVELDDYKTMIRTPPLLTADSGANYVCALLRRLFNCMGLKSLKVQWSGVFSVVQA